MKVDVDMKERMSIMMVFFLQSYKILMGSMLLFFVPQACGEDNHTCNMTEVLNRDTPINNFTIFMNVFTTFTFVIYYLVELKRENMCVQYLDIDQNHGDNNLSKELINYPFIKNKLTTMNILYYYSSVLTLNTYAINLIFSTFILYKNYHSLNTATSFTSFIMLILIKLYNSFYISKDSKENNNALSAYMTEFQSYNVIDKDYKHEINIEQVGQNEFRIVSLEEGKKEKKVMNPLSIDTNKETKEYKNTKQRQNPKIMPKKKKSWSLMANINMF